MPSIRSSNWTIDLVYDRMARLTIDKCRQTRQSVSVYLDYNLGRQATLDPFLATYRIAFPGYSREG
eukprot:1364460-Amorphochlora_amoeboformis.AAC.1